MAQSFALPMAETETSAWVAEFIGGHVSAESVEGRGFMAGVLSGLLLLGDICIFYLFFLSGDPRPSLKPSKHLTSNPECGVRSPGFQVFESSWASSSGRGMRASWCGYDCPRRSVVPLVLPSR